MSAIYKKEKSRILWKAKAIWRGTYARYLRKENIRIKKERDCYKSEVRRLKTALNEERQKNEQKQCITIDKEQNVFLVLQLFLTARISFNAVHRVIDILSQYWEIKTPSVQTVINWVTRLSIARTKYPIFPYQVDKQLLSNGTIWMIDTTIGLGSGRILAILAINMKHFAVNNCAPNLKQVQCVAVAVAPSWTGESIEGFLRKIIAVVGKPAAYLKDGGKDLAKSSRLLNERGYGSFSIADISHIIANLLKHKYKEHPMFNIFISSVGKISKNLKQTILACLAPPKVSTRSRFMNLHRLVRWANDILQHSPKGRASNGSRLSELRACLDRLPECKNFIANFLRDAKALLNCQKILKNKGLSSNTYQECLPYIETIPIQSSVRTGFMNWMDEQLEIAKQLGLENVGMPISSDSIESLFGVSKKHGTSNIKDANRIALRIPSLCGELTIEDARRVMSISVEEQREVENSFTSLIKQRRMILPNPGNLEQLNEDETTSYLELIPKSKNWSKNSNNVVNLKDYKNTHGPSYMLDEINHHPPDALLAQ